MVQNVKIAISENTIAIFCPLGIIEYNINRTC